VKVDRRQLGRFEHAVRADLIARRWLRWHSFLLATLCFGAAWATSAALMRMGLETLALRWPIAFGIAYAVFIGLLWVWCRWLLSRDEADGDPGLDVGDLDVGSGGNADPAFRSAGGGDFGGGGATGSFDGGAEIETAGEAAGTALEAAASADEGIVIAVPLAIVLGMAALIASALGVAVFGLFGIEVLLGVAVEIAIASAGGALAYRARREGWLAHALSRTFWPMVVLLLIVTVLGAAIDHWVPQANSLPQALRFFRG
jgi:hypothetical protein